MESTYEFEFEKGNSQRCSYLGCSTVASENVPATVGSLPVYLFSEESIVFREIAASNSDFYIRIRIANNSTQTLRIQLYVGYLETDKLLIGLSIRALDAV